MRPRLATLATLARVAALAAGVSLACGPAPSTADGGWTALLAPAPVRRLRAALVVEARDCPATLQVAEWFARPEVAGAVGSVTLVVRDGRDSLARYADAALTAPVHLALAPVPRALRPAVRRLGAGPRLVLVDPAGQVRWSGPVPASPGALDSLERVVRLVAEHYAATELATTRSQR